LNATSIAVGNLPYLKSAVDAAEGPGRINPALLDSLMRDPNVLMASAGAPLGSFAKAFGLFGTETTPREGTCNTSFGNFYSSITLSGTNFSVRGAMNADNPDTAKIMSSLFSMIMQQALNAGADKQAGSMLDEVVWEADIPQQAIAEAFKPKPVTITVQAVPPPTTPRKPVRKKRRSN
jgi:hypothetical protein